MPKTELSDPSRVYDSREVPLAELSAMSDANSDETLGRLLPKSEQATPVPVASFQSAI
jgi:hypothetical protein